MCLAARFTLASLLILGGLASSLRADGLPARWVSDQSAIFVAIEQPQTILDLLVNPKLHERLAAIPQYRKSDAPANLVKLGVAATVFEVKLGKSWRDAAREMATGIYLAHEPAANAPVLFVRGKNAELLKKLNQTFIEVIESDARDKGESSPVKSAEHNGVTGWSFGKDEAHTLLDDWLIISNKSDALKAVIDRRQNKDAVSLATNAQFADAAEKNQNSIAWAVLKLDALREAAKLNEGLQKPQNPLVELLFGGIIEAVRDAKLAQVAFRSDDNDLRLTVAVDRPETKRVWFFGGADGVGVRRITVPGMLGTIALSRNVSGMWLDREKLFDAGTNAGFTQADTNLGLFFAGRDFGPDILGSLGSSWQLIVARREFNTGEPVPSIKLPAFALVIEVKDESFADTLIQAYQNIVGITNIQAAQSGRPQLLLGSTEHNGATISKATHTVVPKADSEEGRLDYNFQPSCTRVGKHFVLGSTVEIVRAAIDSLKDGKLSAGGEPSSKSQLNSLIEIDADPILEILNINRDLLATRHALNTGASRDDATAEIDRLYDAARILQRAALNLTAGEKQLELELSIKHRFAP